MDALNITEAAEWLGIPVGTLLDDLAAGELRVSTLNGVVAITVSDLEDWILARRLEPGDLAWSHQVRDPETGRWRSAGRGSGQGGRPHRCHQ